MRTYCLLRRRSATLIGGIVLCCCLALLSLSLASARGQQQQGQERSGAGKTSPPVTLRAEADRLYDEKSYALALEKYRAYLAAAPRNQSDRTAIEYRIAVSLGKAKQWDEAIAAIDSFVKAHGKEALWRARGHYWRGQLLAQIPHQGYRVGTKLYRGRDYPKTDEAEKPVMVYLQNEDFKAALTSFETAIKAYESLPSATRRKAADEEKDLHFDLAKLLPRIKGWGTPDDWKAAKTTDWRVVPTIPYDVKWPTPKKVLFLYARLPRLKPGETDTAVLANLNRALYIAAHRQTWERREGPKWEVVQTIPYHAIDPLKIVLNTAKAYPKHEQAPQLLLIAAQWTQQAGDMAGALALYRRIAEQYPKAKWASDAEVAIENITRAYVNLNTPGPLRVGPKGAVQYGSANVKTLEFRVYKIDIDAFLLETGKLEQPEVTFTDFNRNFGDPAEAAKRGTKVAEWTVATRDKGDYRLVGDSVTTPVSEPGAYLVVASGEGRDGKQTRGATILLISDLSLVKKQDKDEILCFAVDSRSGRPVPGAKVVVKETYWDGNAHRTNIARGQADESGVFVAVRQRGANIHSTNSEAFAYAPGDRYALTQRNGWYGGGDNPNRDEIRVYAYTDRPVYRPKQTVYFRELLAKRTGGGSDYTPLIGVPVTITVNSPRGEQIHQATLTSSEFGSVNGSFILPTGAPLGEYQVRVAVPSVAGQVNDYGGNRFRVEEYKKPEFEVKVTPGATQARFGDTVTATINATYYFGAPVAGGKVSYKVFRNPFHPAYRFPEPYDWLYRYHGDGDYRNQHADGGELVTQGTATTDAKGNAVVKFAATKGERGYRGDYAYTIKAEVTDPSRRVIEGEGMVKVTNQAFYAYVDVKRGFYREGDVVQVEVRTQDANETPVSQEGTLTVYRLTWDEKNQEVATPVHTQTVKTDADGKALTTWRTDESGRFRAEWTARDKWENKVVGAAPVWVAGDKLEAREAFRAGGVTLITDKTTYEQGETARVLILTDQPDVWVLMTQETGNDMISRRLIHVPGRAHTVEVPIARAHIPNFALAAVAVRDYQFFAWQQEIFVPPSGQFVKMEVTSGKADYRPGETGVFKVKTTGADGRPVASEVSLAVVDSSLFYIQKEYAPDIRLFYYGERRAVNVQAESSQHVGIAYYESRPHQDKPTYGIRLPETGRVPGLDQYFPYYFGRQARFNGAEVAGRPIGGFGGGGIGGGFRGGAPASLSAAAPAERATGAAEGLRDETIASYDADGTKEFKKAGKDANMAFAQARVRSYFPDTAFWTPAVVTDKATGEATVEVKFPDTLTTWKASARGLTANVQVGAASTDVITDKKLLVRLAAPRFFVERDRVTLSAIVRNDLKEAKQVRVSLATDEPGVLAVTSEAAAGGAVIPQPGIRTLTVPAGGETRVDFDCRVLSGGNVTVKTLAETDEESDATEQTFPVLAYGVQKFVMQSGILPEDKNKAMLTVKIPQEHRKGTAALMVQVNPSIAATALDALPYLADYPYGCVEQTVSRFLPSVLVAKSLKEAGVDLSTLQKRAEAMRAREAEGTPFGQEKPTDLNTDQTGYTYPSGTPGVMKTAQLAEGLWHTDRWHNPVFDEARLKEMTSEGLARLVAMQRPDGGWGWWSGSSYSDPYMTAYVVYGLATAKEAGVAVPDNVLARGYAFLGKDIPKQDDYRDLAVWEAYALSLRKGQFPAEARTVVARVYKERERLSAYGQALLALTLHNIGEKEQAQTVCRNLQNSATIDRENGTASWRTQYGYWWHWYNNDAETVSWALRAYAAVLPGSDLTPMLVKWLVNHKRGNSWRSTKETAMAVYALTDYMSANRELAADYKVTVALGDKVQRTFTINPENALLFDNRFVVPAELLPGGTETVTITKEGKGRLYWSAAAQYVSTEQKIAGAGTELKVKRRYFRLTPKTGKQADWAGGEYNVLDYNRATLADGASLKSGDLIEVEMVLEAKNDYQYVLFEDMKPSGCEPVERRSGGRYGDGLCSNMELRDTKTAFFVDRLPQGTRVLRYRLRAEVPGAFHALPTNAYAMYAPDVRALSDSWTVTVKD